MDDEQFDEHGVLLDGRTHEDEFLTEVTEIDIHRLDVEMAKLPSELARWNVLLTEAYKTCLVAEADLKREQGRAYLIQAEIPCSNGKPPSVDMIKARVAADEGVAAFQAAYIDAKVEYERLRSISYTVGKKGDMLQGINNRINAELRSNPALRDAMT